MKIVEEKSKGWFQDTAIVFSSSYKIGEFEDQIYKCRWWRTVATQSKSLKEIQRLFFLTKYLQFTHLGNDIPFLSYQLITFLPLWNLTLGWTAQDSADGGILLCFPKMRDASSLCWSQVISQSWSTEPEWHKEKTPTPFLQDKIHTTHFSRDCFSSLPRQLLLQINKCVLNTTARV